jgi:hypothetical protein
VAVSEKLMGLRKKLNKSARNIGNRIHGGLGDTLTKEINVATPLAATGAIAAPLTYAHFMCERMYSTGVVDRMYSSNFLERTTGMLESTGYTVGWAIALPVTALLGAVALGQVGKGLERV